MAVMNVDLNGEMSCLNAELLQLSEVLSPLALKSNPYLAQELFEEWLSLPDTNRLVCFPNPCVFGDTIGVSCTYCPVLIGVFVGFSGFALPGIVM